MLSECLEGLAIKENGIYIDATFGGGGHSGAILSKLRTGRLIAFDKDEDSLRNKIEDPKFMLVQDDFRNIGKRLSDMEVDQVDGLLADLGVSSHQFDAPERGFSIRFEDEVLDMRMNKDQEFSAFNVINEYEESRLADVFYQYGEITQSRKLARAICESRTVNPIRTTGDLKRCISKFIPKQAETQFLARVFQSLRIEVNDELSALRDLLEQAPGLIKKDGRLVVMSYHSLEDRLVKNFIQLGNLSGEDKRDLYGNKQGRSFEPVNRKPILATEEEMTRNPRSRSAKLRIGKRI